MNCCQFDCDESNGCPVRRVRAGGPPPDDLPIQPARAEMLRDKLESAACYALVVVALVFLAIAGAVVFS